MCLWAGVKSKLAAPVQDLMRRIFDIAQMKQALLEFEIDTEKMPLGKLTKEHLKVSPSPSLCSDQLPVCLLARLLRLVPVSQRSLEVLRRLEMLLLSVGADGDADANVASLTAFQSGSLRDLNRSRNGR